MCLHNKQRDLSHWITEEVVEKQRLEKNCLEELGGTENLSQPAAET